MLSFAAGCIPLKKGNKEVLKKLLNTISEGHWFNLCVNINSKAYLQTTGRIPPSPKHGYVTVLLLETFDEVKMFLMASETNTQALTDSTSQMGSEK